MAEGKLQLKLVFIRQKCVSVCAVAYTWCCLVKARVKPTHHELPGKLINSNLEETNCGYVNFIHIPAFFHSKYLKAFSGWSHKKFCNRTIAQANGAAEFPK